MANPDRLSGIATFVEAAEAGNFSMAAERMHLSRSAVAKSVARLEQRLGTRLFHRSTRSQHLTAEGTLFYQRCLRVLAELEQAEAALAQGQLALKGRLRLSMPGLLGRTLIAPLLFALAEQHPGLQWELSLTDRRVDLIEEGFDLAIRSGDLPDNHDYQTRPLGQQHMVLCASPAYLAQRGRPDTPAALTQFDCLIYGRAQQTASWRFEAGATPAQRVDVPARLCLDDLGALLDATLAGLGIARLPLWLVRADLDSGRLLPVLGDSLSVGYPLQLLWPAARQITQRLRLVIDTLAEQLPTRLAGLG
ncbi:LysR substrate-binding domain-containing protein [Paludibacterium sp. THUN1379]|uniref:LysR family transcriptional regulator n=1 Tax=Paludibacterium sp. THUN1379 TaxID=3112107 RepID=UPI00308C021F|nr:LysR substrate-binding domain-containing protein [Paludibacterium sp. THUN1379]